MALRRCGGGRGRGEVRSVVVYSSVRLFEVCTELARDRNSCDRRPCKKPIEQIAHEYSSSHLYEREPRFRAAFAIFSARRSSSQALRSSAASTSLLAASLAADLFDLGLSTCSAPSTPSASALTPLRTFARFACDGASPLEKSTTGGGGRLFLGRGAPSSSSDEMATISGSEAIFGRFGVGGA